MAINKYVSDLDRELKKRGFTRAWACHSDRLNISEPTFSRWMSRESDPIRSILERVVELTNSLKSGEIT